jgi:hypothetical protein
MQMAASAADGMVGADIESGGEQSYCHQWGTGRPAACETASNDLLCSHLKLSCKSNNIFSAVACLCAQARHSILLA